MWLTTSDTIENILVERQLVPVSEEALDQATRGLQSRGVQLSPYEVERTMPVVTLNKPESWMLQDFCTPAQLPYPIQAKLKEADFYVVRFICSFSPIPKQSRIDWARFRVTLLPSTGAQPYAFDLHPERVVQEVKRQMKVTVSPSLKFKELEASVGTADFGFEYDELIPDISGNMGDNSVDPSWDFRPAPGQEVEGPKRLHLLVRSPKGMTSAQARLNIVADVLVRGTRLRGILWRHQAQDTQNVVSLWG